MEKKRDIPKPAPPSRRLSVGFLLRPRFTLLPFSAMADILRLAADDGDGSRPIRCTWVVVGRDRSAVTASCGIEITPNEPYGDPSRFDVLVVVGGLTHADPAIDTETLAYLRQADQCGLTIIGLCTGTFTLLRAGLLTGRKCCVHWFHLSDILDSFPETQPVADRLFVVDGRYITCAGGVAAIDVGAWLVERYLGRAAAQKSLHIMLVDQARSPSSSQPQPPAPRLAHTNRVKRAMLLIEQNLNEPLAIDGIAGQLGVSGRHLERLFRQELGLSVQEYSRQLRLRYGLWLHVNGGQSIASVADTCGFADPSHFSRLCRQTFGRNPTSFTKRHVDEILANFHILCTNSDLSPARRSLRTRIPRPYL